MCRRIVKFIYFEKTAKFFKPAVCLLYELVRGFMSFSQYIWTLHMYVWLEVATISLDKWTVISKQQQKQKTENTWKQTPPQVTGQKIRGWAVNLVVLNKDLPI